MDRHITCGRGADRARTIYFGEKEAVHSYFIYLYRSAPLCILFLRLILLDVSARVLGNEGLLIAVCSTRTTCYLSLSPEGQGLDCRLLPTRAQPRRWRFNLRP